MLIPSPRQFNVNNYVELDKDEDRIGSRLSADHPENLNSKIPQSNAYTAVPLCTRDTKIATV